MLLVDSSVWIDFFNGRPTAETFYLRDQAERDRIAVGDLILCEVLQGFRSDQDVQSVKELLFGFHYFDLAGQAVSLQAAQHCPSGNPGSHCRLLTIAPFRLLEEPKIDLRKPTQARIQVPNVVP